MAIDRKVYVVVNPHSANGSTRRVWQEMEAQLRDAIGPFDWRFTTQPREATTIAAEAAATGYDAVIAVGGDGTNNEVVNGLFDGDKLINPDCAFGFICRGTGGDFRKSFGWGTELEEAIARFKKMDTRRIDLGRFSYIDHEDIERHSMFINITSFGMSGLVDHLVNTTTKALGGKASFLMGTLRALLAYRNQRVHLRLDEAFDETLPVRIVSVANGRFFGGGMMMAPDAELDDGLFDVVIMGDMSRMDMLMQGSSIYTGQHLSKPKISLHRARTIIAEPEDPEARILIDMDGEQPGRLPCRFDIVPQVLPLIG